MITRLAAAILPLLLACALLPGRAFGVEEKLVRLTFGNGWRRAMKLESRPLRVWVIN